MTTNRHPSLLRGRLEAARLYLIVGREAHGGRDPIEVARQAVEGGVGVLQIRLKEEETHAIAAFTRDVQQAVRDEDVLVIVNDDLEAAMVAGADGIHLGQDDLDPAEARRQAGDDFLIGLSTHSLDDLPGAEDTSVDYLGVGAMFMTGTKQKPLVLGPQILGEFKDRISMPWFAIGGIREDNVHEVVQNGGQRIAVSAAIMSAPDPKRAARHLWAALG